MDVKRYGAIYSMVEVTPELLANHPSMDIYVCGKDFDRVTAERDALQQLLNKRDEQLAEQHQGEPVAYLTKIGGIVELHRADSDWIVKLKAKGFTPEPLYTHADPGEVERLRQFQTAYMEWSDKTDGVQQTVAPKELGMHRADVIRQRFDTLRDQLAECEAMAAMIAEREWAEHVGTGPVSSKVEAAFTQLHNDLHETGEKLAKQDALFGKYGDTLRPFVELMRKELEANNHKGDRNGWLQMDQQKAVAEIDHHVGKLHGALGHLDVEAVQEHAADIANCCMMFLDVVGLLDISASAEPISVHQDSASAKLSIVMEAAKALIATVEVCRATREEQDDVHTHEKWAMDDLEKSLYASAEPIAPDEIDERAPIKPDAWRASINGNWEYFRSYKQALEELRQWQSDYLPEEIEEAKADGLYEPDPVYSRAVLERKP